MNAMCVYDFTYSFEKICRIELIKLLSKNCKKWVFQTEVGEKTGYKHFQGRFSLKVKKRLNQVIKMMGCHVSITSKDNKDNDFYCIKDETRIDGPWDDTKDKIMYIPRQIRQIKELYPWQKQIIMSIEIWDTRRVNIIVDTKGCNGKSTICMWIGCYGLGNMIPFCNNYKDLMRMVYDMPTRKCYMIDMPRAINKENLAQLYSACETVKGGFCYDDRYNYKCKYFDCPTVWVFTNHKPDLNMFTNDRWNFWEIGDDKELKALKL